MKKFLIYKVSGGLNHMMIQINNAVEVSKRTNRSLIIDCNSGAFQNDFDDFFEIDVDYSTNYDSLYKNFDEKNMIDFIKNTSVKYINKNYYLGEKKINYSQDELLSTTDDVVVMTAISKNFEKSCNIKVRKNILEEIMSIGEIKNYIGLHFRNTDIKNDIESFIIKANSIQDYNKLYLSTDDSKAKNLFLESLKRFEIINYTTPMNNDGKNIHYGNPNKKDVITNALIDMYYLTKSDIFIPSNNSSFSKKIISMREKKDNIFF